MEESRPSYHKRVDNVRPLDTQDHMSRMAAGAVGKRLTYADLIGPKDTTEWV